jgi:alpha-amylase/alpha-mannosidase (GH57 family)
LNPDFPPFLMASAGNSGIQPPVTKRYLCIHCHFYQPPRENPWLEAVELQDSAWPYHDWNERITAECYGPNGASRLLDSENRIVRITNNYARISFNFGPTLLSWMEDNAHTAYQAILDADRESRKLRSGHGNALAQAYNHMILPLANRADKYTQLVWGIRDFERRFGRSPEGMWLPEAAADTETLDMMSDLGIQFTILAPRQAARVRRIGGRAWKDVHGGIDPSRAYRMRLPSRRSINLFFYDGPISQAVAFEGLLNNGEAFANRLLAGFSDARTWPQFMHIATDGETYGHHHKYGDMALAVALEHIESHNLARVTNYAEFLEKHPPDHEVQIVENSSWSCSHGVERWKSDCGCNTGRHAGWDQQWRGPLRESFDWLRDELAPKFEQRGFQLMNDPWLARKEYIDVVLDRSPASLAGFFARHARREAVDTAPHDGAPPTVPALSHDEQVTTLKLLEIQRHLMLMYTSCGWFFDEVSGLEAVQVMMYAGCAVQLAQQLFGDHLEESFLEKLAQIRSNVAEQGTAADIYRKWVKPAAIDLVKVGAHCVISSLFERYDDHASIYCYNVDRRDHQLLESGRARLALGRAQICSQITLECAELSFGALHLGDHNINAGVRLFRDDASYASLVQECSQAFLSGDLTHALRALDRQFEGVTYSLRSLFRDEQRKIISIILDSTLAAVSNSFREIYEDHAQLLRFLAELGTPTPRVLRLTAEFVINSSLRREFEKEDLDLDRIGALFDVAAREKIALDGPGLSYAVKRTIEDMMAHLMAEPRDIALLERVEAVTEMVRGLPFEVSLWKTQNRYWQILREVHADFLARDDEESRRWLEHFDRLGEKLGIRVPAPTPALAEAPLPSAD